MSGGGEKPVIPEIKIEEPDPSELSYREKLSRFGANLLGASSSSLISPTSSTPPPAFKMLEAWKAQFELKTESIEVELAALKASLSAEPPVISQVGIDLHFLQSQVREAKSLHQKILDILLKDKNQKEDCKKRETALSALLRKVYVQELVAQDLLKEADNVKVEEEEEEAGEEEAMMLDNEKFITEDQGQLLHNAIQKIEGELAKEEPHRDRLPEMIDNMQVCWSSFLQCQTAFVERLRAAKQPNNVVAEMSLRRKYQLRIAKVERRAKELVTPPENDARSPTIVVGDRHENYHKDLPKLAGHPKEWLPFWAIFKETHDNRNLTQLQKFRRLMQATKEDSPARDTVNLYAMSASNYTEALEHLKRDYGRESILVKIYVREILQLAIDRSSGGQIEFRKMVNELTANLKNLESLNVTSQQYSQFLYPMLEACLPKPMLQLWQEKESEDLKELIKFLQKQVEKENERRLAHFSFAEQKPKENPKGKFGDKQREGARGKRKSIPTAAGFHNAEERETCIFCEGRHQSIDCRKALQMTFEERQAKIKERNVCFICFKKGHMSRRCRDRGKVKCNSCGKNHQSVLCPDLQPQQHERREENLANRTTTPTAPPQHEVEQHRQQQPQPHSSSTSNFSNFMQTSEVPLQLLLVRVEGANGKKKIVTAMLDSGSTTSYVTTALQEEMGFVKTGDETVVHKLFGGVVIGPQTHDIVKLHVSGIGGEQPCNFIVNCIPQIAQTPGSMPTGKWVEEFMERGVVFPRFPEDQREVDMLIGNDVAPKLYLNKTVDLGNGPVAVQTRWGWVLGGKIPVYQPPKKKLINNNHITTTICNLSLTQLWDLDLIGIKDEPSTQSTAELAKQTEQHFLRNVKREDDGRYQVRLPFLTGAVTTLPSNFNAAANRLRTTTDSLRKSNYLEKYNSLFRQWEEEGMIESVNTEEMAEWKDSGHYLPHRAVIKLSSETTPVRPVFDASAKSKGSPSLNMCLDAGPNYLELIPSILTRFRLRKIGVTADIRKAFQQISVAPDHRPFLRFLWWKNHNKCDQLKVYQHSRVAFGVSCSPFLLAATLQHHLRQSPPSHEATAEMLMRSLYVDNCFESLSSITKALNFQKQSIELLAPAKFDLREWSIGPTGEEKDVPALGMIWDMGRDTLRVDVEAALEKMTSPPTQRNVLSLAHSLFDPLGTISPFILPAKLLLRRCHEEKLGWDKPLPQHLEEEYEKWKKQIPIISQIRIPRYAYLDQSSKSSLHVFSDASGDAYAAVVFLRCETAGGVKVTLLQSRSRILTKTMKITIPRSELIGCLIGVRLAATVREDIGEPLLPVTYYTDSSTALAWIQGEGPWGIFVANRTEEIRKKTSVYQWRHVRGKDNPADLPSRGCSSRKLLESEWWRGPDWLYKPERMWPVSTSVVPVLEEINKERRKAVAVNVVAVGDTHPLEKFLRVSDYPKIIRFVSYWRRYGEILKARIIDPNRSSLSCRRRQRKTPYHVPIPTLAETEEAERVILRHVQKDLNSQHLRKLRPFTNEGILRTSTPIFHDQDNNFVHPIILPEKNEFVLRLLRWIHESGCHMGTQLLQGKAREKFWVINGRKVCRGVVGRCWTCRRFNARKLEVPEVSLPRARTATGVPFSVIGVDMAGPFIPTLGEKVWVALFTCATYRAIHLEVVDAMSTDEFLNAFRAFTCRRGKPKIVYSDNGLNFVGANTAFQKTYKKEAQISATERGIEWRFNPPNAPWVGGFYERLIGLVKSLTVKVLGKRVVTRKELVGLLLEVEEIVNNRPLTYVSESHDDPVPLTPNMMVRNTGLSNFPELDIRDASHAREAVKHIQRLREMLRSSFRRLYLGALSNKRVGGTFRPLKPDDVVLLEQNNVKRVCWPLGVIVEVILGRDGFPRTYLVKSKLGVVPRAAQKLYPMELQEPGESCGESPEHHAPTPTTTEDTEHEK